MPAAGGSPTPRTDDVLQAAQWLLAGGVIAYPTATVYGIGCLPDDAAALEQVLRVKDRDAGKGLIIIAAHRAQLAPFAAELGDEQWDQIEQPESPPTTWVVPATTSLSALISGGRETVAVRISRWPITQALCEAAGTALVSTSANLSGQPATMDYRSLSPELLRHLNGVLIGECANIGKPSTIRDLLSGAVLRP